MINSIFATLFPHIKPPTPRRPTMDLRPEDELEGGPLANSQEDPAATRPRIVPEPLSTRPRVYQPPSAPGMPVMPVNTLPSVTQEMPGSMVPPPNPDVPPEDARGALEFWQKMYDNPRNLDKGWKGMLKEIAQNFLYGMGQAQPDMDWKQTLAAGGIGAGAGLASRGWNEQREAARRIPGLQKRVEFEDAEAKREADRKNVENQIANRDLQTKIEIDKETRLRISDAQNRVVEKWKAVPNFDPNDPKFKDLVQEAEQARVKLPPKSRAGRYGTKFAPNGDLIVEDKDEGTVRNTGENFAKPPTITDRELPDEMFGLYSDKEIEDLALKETGVKTKGKRVRGDAGKRYPQFVRDGKFDEAAWQKARDLGDVEGDIYEDAPDDYNQRVASARNKIRASQAELRREVANFRSTLGNYKPNANAAPVALPRVVELFNKVMQLPPKERAAKLKEFYSNLPNIRIQ